MTVDWHVPLAERMRPREPSELIGQAHLLDAGKPLNRILLGAPLHSMILWGPPGSGKTTLARVLADRSIATMLTLSAVTSGVQDIRNAVKQAAEIRQSGGQVLLFVDEVHRFNKAQQDAFLPHIENGTIVLVGATTENPSFELNNALLSRTRIYLLKELQQQDVKHLIRAALKDEERGLGSLELDISEPAVDMLSAAARGDARRALGFLETASDLTASSAPGKRQDGDRPVVTIEHIRQVMTESTVRFDKQGEHFYDQISALHKSIRGSSPDAALYWSIRMLRGGCDANYLLRRLVRIALEDVGNADPRALSLALDAWNAYERLGSPEGDLAISQAVIFLAVAAKSNAVYQAHQAAHQAVTENPELPVPVHLRNAPTRLSRQLNHGKGYRYAHDEPGSYAAGQRYLPEEMGDPGYYQPTANGLEQKIKEKLSRLKALDAGAGG